MGTKVNITSIYVVEEFVEKGLYVNEAVVLTEGAPDRSVLRMKFITVRSTRSNNFRQSLNEFSGAFSK